MGFNSLELIFLVLPGFLGGYYLFPPSRRNMVLALGSMVFYVIGTWRHPRWIVHQAAEVMITRATGQILPHINAKTRLLSAGLVLLIGI